MFHPQGAVFFSWICLQKSTFFPCSWIIHEDHTWMSVQSTLLAATFSWLQYIESALCINRDVKLWDKWCFWSLSQPISQSYLLITYHSLLFASIPLQMYVFAQFVGCISHSWFPIFFLPRWRVILPIFPENGWVTEQGHKTQPCAPTDIILNFPCSRQNNHKIMYVCQWPSSLYYILPGYMTSYCLSMAMALWESSMLICWVWVSIQTVEPRVGQLLTHWKICCIVCRYGAWTTWSALRRWSVTRAVWLVWLCPGDGCFRELWTAQSRWVL